MLGMVAISAGFGGCVGLSDNEPVPRPSGREPLGSLANGHGRHVSTFLFSTDGPQGADQAAFRTALDEFDLYVLPVFPNLVQPERGVFDFTLPDAVADSAPEGTVFFVPGVVWNDLQPAWLEDGGFSGEQLRALLVEMVTEVVAHYSRRYGDRVIAFEIVLEPLSWQGPGGFWHTIGLDAGLDQYEYIRLALRTARDVAPTAKLYITDFGVEDLGPKADRYLELVSGLLEDDVPIDGVGYEGHFMVQSGGAFPAAPAEETVAASLGRFGALGLDTMITSIDVAVRDSDVTETSLEEQALAYRRLVRACLAEASCRAWGTWGLGDADSWIPQYFPGWGSPLMFDASYAAKPAFHAVRTELER